VVSVELDEPYLYLTTVGRKSGNDHEIEIWFVALGGAYYLISEKRERADWVRNLRKEPRVRFRVGAASFIGRARALDGAGDAELVARVEELFDEKYGWSAGLVVELRPVQS
jgi:deazaflavin-dependent oxidoreductase (nitroreductase family)